MAKVSIVLPAYKRRFLKEAITSILAQTYRDFELIVVDDCSPENLKRIVDEFHDERLTYIRNETNIGGRDLIAAWNHAMSFATGEWCVLASDDDLYHPEYLAEMLSLAGKYTHVNLVHCRNCEIDQNGTVMLIGAPRAEFESGIQMLYNSSVLRIHQRMADLMFRRTAYDALGGFPRLPLAWYADHAFAIQMSWRVGAACSNRILFKFRNSGENLSTRGMCVAQKIEAGLLFVDHIERLIDSVDGETLLPDDRLILNFCRKGVETNVEMLCRFELMKLHFGSFVRVLYKSRLHKALKRRLMLIRLGGLLDLRKPLFRLCGGHV